MLTPQKLCAHHVQRLAPTPVPADAPVLSVEDGLYDWAEGGTDHINLDQASMQSAAAFPELSGPSVTGREAAGAWSAAAVRSADGRIQEVIRKGGYFPSLHGSTDATPHHSKPAAKGSPVRRAATQGSASGVGSDGHDVQVVRPRQGRASRKGRQLMSFGGARTYR